MLRLVTSRALPGNMFQHPRVNKLRSTSAALHTAPLPVSIRTRSGPMRRTGMTGAGLAAAAVAATALLAAQSPAAPAPTDAAAGFTLTSTDISAGGQIAERQAFNGFGCKGGNVSPALAWGPPPARARGLAPPMHDPGA